MRSLSRMNALQSRAVPRVVRAIGSARMSTKITTHYKKNDRSTDARWADVDMESFADETDVLIIGGGPAGLSAAIRIKQLCVEHGQDFRVTVIEKASMLGSHTLSGAVLEPRWGKRDSNAQPSDLE